MSEPRSMSFDNIDEDLLDMIEDPELCKQLGIDASNPIEEENVPTKVDKCPSCQSTEFVEDFAQGIVICHNCGQVIDMIVDSRPDWNKADDGPSNRGSIPINPLLPQSTLGTTMNCYGMVKKLHDWSSMPYRERMLNNVLKEIRQKCRDGNIMKCIEEDAEIMFKNISECKHQSGKNKGRYIIMRGSNRRSLIAACVFFACKRRNKARTHHEIAKIFGLRYTDITKGCKNFLKYMEMRKMNLKFSYSSPVHFVERYCRKLHIKNSCAEMAQRIANNTIRLNLASDHTPPSIATASIMLMAELQGLSITKRSVANKFNVSEVTITKAYRKMLSRAELLLCDEAVEAIVSKIKVNREKAKKTYDPSKEGSIVELEPEKKKVVDDADDQESGSDSSGDDGMYALEELYDRISEVMRYSEEVSREIINGENKCRKALPARR